MFSEKLIYEKKNKHPQKHVTSIFLSTGKTASKQYAAAIYSEWSQMKQIGGTFETNNSHTQRQFPLLHPYMKSLFS
jgi:hypothetical protein